MMLFTLFEQCVLWVSRGPVNACVDSVWSAAWVSLPF